MTAITVPENEQGKIRVFSLSLSDKEAETLSGEGLTKAEPPLARALGAEKINPGFVEVFRTDDLDQIGLTGYLIEGNGAVASQVTRDTARLSGLDGWVMMVYSAAFGGTAQTLTPAPALTLIGTYDEERPDMTATPIPSEAAQPYSGVAQLNPVVPPRGGAGGLLMLAGLAVMVILLLWWALT